MRSLASLLATFFGVGHIPFASGTFGSLAALPFGFAFVLLGWHVIALAAILAVGLGVWACGQQCAKCAVTDPSECVLDEVAGQWIALVPVALYSRPFDWRAYALSFVLFRAFDVLKPWPLSAAERLPGGYGVMADDVLAGLIAAGLLAAALNIGWV